MTERNQKAEKLDVVKPHEVHEVTEKLQRAAAVGPNDSHQTYNPMQAFNETQKFNDSLPKTPEGKIDTSKLTENQWNEIAKRVAENERPGGTIDQVRQHIAKVQDQHTKMLTTMNYAQA